MRRDCNSLVFRCLLRRFNPLAKYKPIDGVFYWVPVTCRPGIVTIGHTCLCLNDSLDYDRVAHESLDVHSLVHFIPLPRHTVDNQQAK